MAKKLLSIATALLMVLALVPVGALANGAAAPASAKDPEALPEWDFETDPADAGWEFVDSDGDGHNWHWETDPDAVEAHGGEGALMSESYDNPTFTPLTPDNWALLPMVSDDLDENAKLTFWYKGLDPSYPEEHFMVYYGRSGATGNMTPISEELVATGEYQEFSVDLDDIISIGGVICFAIRHFNSTDRYALVIDDVSVEGASLYTEPTVITEVNVDGFTTPHVGDAAGDHLAAVVSEGANYYVSSTYWIEVESTAILDDDETFISGTYYQRNIILRPNEGYVFADDCVMTLDGSTEFIDADRTVVSNLLPGVSIAVIWTVELLPLEDGPVEPTPVPGLNELDAALNVPGGALHFENVASYDWIVETEGDRVYAKSGNAGIANSTSSVETHVEIAEGGGNVTFDYMACGETANYGSSIYDHCYFIIDGTQVFNKGNEESLGWQNYIISLSPGEHTLRWYYSKDGSVNSPQDCFKLDNVAIVGEVVVEPTPTPIPVDPEELDAALNVEGGTIHFENDASYPWTVETDGDRVYAKSGNGGVHETTSSITATVTVDDEGMMVRFDLIARGEGYDSVDWDTCRFFVDGEMVMKYGSHDEVWESFEWALTPGEHELMWQYKKDHSTHPAGDYFAVDNVEIVEGTPVLPEEITEIRIYGFSVPLWGEHPDYELELLENAPYSIREVLWYYSNSEDEDDVGTLDPSEYFDSELRSYEMLVRLDAAEGYVFADEVAVYINDRATLVAAHDYSVFGYYYVYTHEYEVDPSVVTPTAVPMEPTGPIWDFENDPEDQGWTFVDSDGDGYGWEWVLDWYNEYSFHEGDGFITSYSYDNDSGNALYPDNWAITPAFTVPEDGTFSFWAQGQDPDYPFEIFGVYLKVAGSENWVQIGEDDMTWGVDLRYDYDISEYAGQSVQVAIRHYNIYDMFEINVDYVVVNAGPLDPPPEPEAIHDVYVNGFEAPVEGELAADHMHLTTPLDAPYYIIYGGWLDETDQQQLWQDDAAFVAGHVYSEGCQIWAEDGYYFAEDCVFHIEGAELDTAWSYVDSEYNYICYINSVPVMCGLMGDANGDGTVDITDALLVLRYAMSLIGDSALNTAVCDVNGDGAVDITDALLVLRYAMALIPSFPN